MKLSTTKELESVILAEVGDGQPRQASRVLNIGNVEGWVTLGPFANFDVGL